MIITQSNLDRVIRQSKQRNYIYLNNPKSACSTIKYNLWKQEYKLGNVSSYPENSLDVHKRENPIFKKNWVLEDWKTWFIFSFVRNPFTRLLSAYLDKICKKTPERQYLYDLADIHNNKTISFQYFVEIISNFSSEQDNPHWKCQSEHFLLSYIPIHFIGYFEQIQVDLNILWHKIFGISAENIRTWTPHKTDAGNLLETYYNQRTINLVLQKYEQDFINFGYSDSLKYIQPVKILRDFCIDRTNFLAVSAYSMAKRGMQKQALSQIREAISRCPDNPMFHHYLGNLLAEQGAYKAAEEAQKKAIKKINDRGILNNYLVTKKDQQWQIPSLVFHKKNHCSSFLSYQVLQDLKRVRERVQQQKAELKKLSSKE